MPEQQTGRERLRQALTRPVSRGQVTAAVLLAIVGFASVVQVQSQDRDANFAGARQQDLIQLLDSLNLASERAENEIADLEEARSSLRNDADSSNAALQEAREQAAALSILAGTVPAVGPGIVAEVRAPAGRVGIDQLLNGLEELRDAGAEAIEINNTVRVVAQTSLTDGEAGVVVDGQQLSPPYTIEAVGEPNTLAQALDFTGGFIDEVEGEAIGGQVRVEQREAVEISTVREPNEPEYAEPTEQE
ncbi:MAG: hypothetical protein AVDCRST_MAG72-882 [uncultured Nocardioidaceae bacterium]|uniref:Division initiation protein n=1 Tax=uncultured Nocardioidaceae bacterium TaxID=253824 RepID=A0A6J4LTP0_9ACTN|nr:MAG: hypothetical protein AVDCRST_MAG72-882 [uncultured Nocardioidaceae bacterium]